MLIRRLVFVMTKQISETGYSKNRLPYACYGKGRRQLVIFDGLDFNHKPPSGLALKMSTNYLAGLENDYRIYLVKRKEHLPRGYSLRNMADDYAEMIKNELGGRADIIGISTGGAVAQELAIVYPDLTRRLVLAMSGYRLHPEARELQRRVADLAGRGKKREAYALLGATIYRRGLMKALIQGLMWLMAANGIPGDPNDGIVEIEAEDNYDSGSRLSLIKSPVLVIGGEDDFFYPIAETAQKIPSARLVLLPGAGHNAIFKYRRRFNEEIRKFLDVE